MGNAKTLSIGTIAGLIAGTIDLAVAIPIQTAFGIPPLVLLQSMASSTMGRSAYAGGIGSASVGVGLHYLVSVVAGIIFAVAASSLPILRRRAVTMGALYGVGAYIVLHFVVLPLSAIAYKPDYGLRTIVITLALHIVPFAIPITLYVQRRMPPA